MTHNPIWLLANVFTFSTCLAIGFGCQSAPSSPQDEMDDWLAELRAQGAEIEIVGTVLDRVTILCIKTDRITQRDIDMIAKMETLKLLMLTHCRDFNVDLAALQSNKRLEQLNLDGSTIKDVHIESLTQHPTLEIVGLTKCQGLTKKGIGHLLSIPNIQKIWLDYVPLVDDDFVEKASKLPNIHLLSLMKCGITDKSIPHIIKMEKL